MSSKQLGALFLTLLVLAAAAYGWHRHGHVLASRAAVDVAGPQLPAFFAAGTDTIANVSLDNDAFTRPIAPAQLHEAEAPEHFFDIELLGGQPVPPSRYAFIDFCYAHGLKPNQVGLLPYAIMEWTQRLTVAFAEYRKWPNDPTIQAKCLVYAGLLSHYAADCCQPLHITIHWDGRATADGKSPHSGIHNRVDALPAKLSLSPRKLAEGLKAQPFPDLFSAILAEMDRSHKLVDRVYELDSQIPPMDSNQPLMAEAAEFTKQRMRAAAIFTASLYLTAWQDSAKIELPAWHRAFSVAAQPAATAPASAP
ncbi:MAG: hypothetical protein ABSH10_08580 [Phycisphaerae bacterium]|jgi:hypothetical protein